MLLHRVMAIAASGRLRRLEDTSVTGNSIFSGIQRLRKRLAVTLTKDTFAIASCLGK